MGAMLSKKSRHAPNLPNKQIMASSSYEQEAVVVAAAASSSSAPPYTGKWEHDVFVCFRGDTRGGFTSHLGGQLRELGIRTFTDNLLERTEDIDELLSVLKRSALSVVIFSQKFAESSWCLDEVATIVESMGKFGHQVLPVFYHVDPEDVSDDHGSYASTIDAIHKPTPKVKNRWRDALKLVAKHAGRTSIEINDDEELCNTIVNDVLKKLTGMSSRGKFNNKLVGIDTRVSKVQQLLAIDGTSNGTRVIGLWGMGGVGKTTLAKACYQILTSSTSRIKHHFVSDVDNNYKTRRELEVVVQGLYSNLLSEKNLSLEDLDVDYRRERLSRLKVVVVLDNVETKLQLEQLLLGEILDPAKLFGPESIIIITSRNRAVPCLVNALTVEVNGLGPSESLKLFSLRAFKQVCPPSEDFMELSERAVSYCQGNPLAITVLGGVLAGKGIKYWRSSFSGWADNTKPEIHDILSTSYHALRIEEQRLFLDVACLFPAIHRSVMIRSLANSHRSADSLVEDLVDKSLLGCTSITIDGYDHEMIVVHDLLKEMAWNIVKGEPTPRFLKKPDDVRKLFAFRDYSRKAVEAINLDLSRAKEMHLGADAFEGMNSLRTLQFDYPEARFFLTPRKIYLPPDGLDMLPNELRFLTWVGFPSSFLPEKFIPKELVLLSLSHSGIIECWKGVQPKLVHLFSLDLSYCIYLRKVPNLSGCKNLEMLRLKGCTSLVVLPPAVQGLHRLYLLNLSACPNLEVLPARLDSKCLEYVFLSNCPKVTLCPEINNSERGLLSLDLEGTPVREVPSAIHKVRQSGVIRVCGEHITSFPRISTSLALLRLCHTTIKDTYVLDNFSSEECLPRFDSLELVGNSQLVSLSNNIWDVVKHRLWIESSTLVESLPDILHPVNDLRQIHVLDCGNLRSFPSGISNMRSLLDIRYSGTAIKSLPSSILVLDQLLTLFLSFCESLESLPVNMHQLAKLHGLFMTGCVKIISLPELPPSLEVLGVSRCKSLQALPSNIGKLNWSDLCFDNCPQLENKLPDQITENFHKHAIVAQQDKGAVLCSGSDLPEWCSNNSMDCEMELPLPAADRGDDQQELRRVVKGVAFGVVFSSNDVDVFMVKLKCDVAFDDVAIVTIWSDDFGSGRGTTGVSSDYVYLWFEKNLVGETKEEEEEEEEEEPWYVKYAGCTVSFRIDILPGREQDVNKLTNMKLKKFGASLLY